jgi:hypothetical protein
VRCAGDRIAPCVIEDVVGSDARYRRFDPVTGAIGDVWYRAPLTGRYLRGMALSPDGTRLALVDGGSAATIVDAEGATSRLDAGAGTELDSVAWAHDGVSLLVTGLGGGPRLFRLLRLAPGATPVLVDDSSQRSPWRAEEAPDGARLAIQGHDLVLDLWLVDGF